jgi:LemA family
MSPTLCVVRRLQIPLVIVLAALLLSGCGINTIPSSEENAKAKWSDVQNQDQRRADLIPNLVETVKGYATQEREVLTQVTEARAKASQVKVDASTVTDPAKFKEYQDAQNALYRRSWATVGDGGALSGLEVEPEFPRPTIAARRHGKPYFRCSSRLHRGRPGI